MPLKRRREQHIAVFGESGSGKTVLVSSFYGATQEPQFIEPSLFYVVADDAGQSSRLYQNYLGMRDKAELPEGTRFAPSSYAFSVQLKDGGIQPKKGKKRDVVRLVWHDYPGEWFEQEVSGPEEARRRIDTFRSLLRSDVALILVDGQRLLDHAGEEERYLKSLFGNLRTGLLRLRDDLLEDGRPLAQFPRIWVVSLSKADLLPDLDVFGFRDLVIGRAGGDLDELRKVLAGMVESKEALSVGEDLVLLSSAKFQPNRIEVTERVGLDLVLPIAAMLPLERYTRWADKKVLGAGLLGSLVGGIKALITALAKQDKDENDPVKTKGTQERKSAATQIVTLAAREGLDAMTKLTSDQLKRLNDEAVAKRDYLTAVLTRFRLDMERGEEAKILLRSKR